MFALDVSALRKDLVGYCILDLRTAQMNGTKVTNLSTTIVFALYLVFDTIPLQYFYENSKL